MYKTIKGIYKKGRIVPLEAVEFTQDEVEVIITFLREEKRIKEKPLSSADRLLYTMGDRALEGKFTDASERHDNYLYGKDWALKRLFIDTGAWIALNNKKDKYHTNAVKANKDFLDKGYFYITSDYILDETYTLLRSDVGHKRAVEFGKEVKSLKETDKIRIVYINQDILDKAWEIFEKYSDKDFSFTDCTSFIVMETVEINEALSFDKHFEQYGFTRLPI